MSEEKLRELIGMAYQWVAALASRIDELDESYNTCFGHSATQKMLDILSDPDKFKDEEIPTCKF